MSNKEEVANHIQQDISKFNFGLGSVAGINNIAPYMGKWNDQDLNTLEGLRLRLQEDNLNFALNSTNIKINEIGAKHGDVTEIKKEYNPLKREFEKFKKEKAIDYEGKITKYTEIYDKTIRIKDKVEDEKESLIRKGKKSFLTIYGIFLSIWLTFYTSIVAVTKDLATEAFKNNYLNLILWIPLITSILIYMAIGKYLNKY